MAVDLYIEVFSVDLFRSLWYKLGLKKLIIPRLRNYDTVTDQFACSEAVTHAVMCRRTFFQPYFRDEIPQDYELYAKSNLDCYLYLKNNMVNYPPYKGLNVFDKLLMTCAVVFEMGLTCYVKQDSMYAYNCPLAFAMYFDTECKEEFYNGGGWTEFELHAFNYQARVLTQPFNEKHVWCARSSCAEAMHIEYSFELINQAFMEKICSEKSRTCPQCLPLFHAIKMVCGVHDETITNYQMTESFLQIILRMLSFYELLNGDQDFLKDSEFKSVQQVLNIANSYSVAKMQQQRELRSDEKTSHEKCNVVLRKYQDQNTRIFLSRLFKDYNDPDNTGDRCMFCACKVNELPKVLKSESDTQVERIKSAIHDTVIDMPFKDKPAEVSVKYDKNNPNKKDNNIKDALKLFVSLGTQPLTSDILEYLEKRSKKPRSINKLTDSLAKMQIDKAPKHEAKENARKNKVTKNKLKVCTDCKCYMKD